VPRDVRNDDRRPDPLPEEEGHESTPAVFGPRRNHRHRGLIANRPPPAELLPISETHVQRARIRIEARDVSHGVAEPLEADEEGALADAGDDRAAQPDQRRNRGITWCANSSIVRRARAFSIIPKLIWNVG
jgi:hypothetical protein